MKMDEALEMLSAKFPETYVCITYEKIKTSSGYLTTEIKAYVADEGWSPAYQTYDSAVAYFTTPKTVDPAPSDGSDE